MGSTAESEASAALVERILQGDKQAETHMVERYQGGLTSVLKRNVNRGDLHVIDDIIQETWRLVLEKVRANQLNDHQKLSAFIVTIGKNQLLMHYRKNQNKTFVADDELELSADPTAGPQKQLEQFKTKKLVRGLIDRLKKPRDREILTRYYFDEESKHSIREAYDLDELHLNRVLHRARQRFKQLWQSEASEGANDE